MKIAIMRKKYTYHGGSESFSSAFVKGLSERGHEVHIYAIEWDGQNMNENIFFHNVPAITFLSLLRDLSFALSSRFILVKHRSDFDIIQSHDKTLYQDIYRAGDGCHIEWLKQRWSRTGAAGKVSMLLNPYHWLILLLERSILKGGRFRKIIAISELVKENIMRNYQVPAERIEVIYNGVDLDRFTPVNRERYRGKIRQKYGIGKDDPVLLFVGSGFERKGVAYLLEAMASVRGGATLLIVGKGRHAPQSRPAQRGIHKIIFCGPQKEIDQYYAAADVFIFPTIYEPFGNVHLEALASGLPVITSKNSGAAEVITDGVHGFVIERPEDIGALSEKINYLMQHRDMMISMSENARRRAEEFSYERHIEIVEKLYEGIINEKESK